MRLENERHRYPRDQPRPDPRLLAVRHARPQTSPGQRARIEAARSKQMRVLRLLAIRLIFSVMDLCSEEHSNECNNQAVRNSLHGRDLEVPPILNFEDFLFSEENAID